MEMIFPELNTNIKERDTILFGEYDPSAYKYGGIRHFEYLDYPTLQKLVDKKFIDPEGCQNYSPSTGDFLAFMEAHPEFTAHGYAIGLNRDDYRITIEGIESDEIFSDVGTLEEFVGLCRFADYFCLNPPYAWWD